MTLWGPILAVHSQKWCMHILGVLGVLGVLGARLSGIPLPEVSAWGRAVWGGAVWVLWVVGW
eukprot:5594045-Prymnesium_polylepis.1